MLRLYCKWRDAHCALTSRNLWVFPNQAVHHMLLQTSFGSWLHDMFSNVFVFSDVWCTLWPSMSDSKVWTQSRSLLDIFGQWYLARSSFLYWCTRNLSNPRTSHYSLSSIIKSLVFITLCLYSNIYFNLIRDHDDRESEREPFRKGGQAEYSREKQSTLAAHATGTPSFWGSVFRILRKTDDPKNCDQNLIEYLLNSSSKCEHGNPIWVCFRTLSERHSEPKIVIWLLSASTSTIKHIDNTFLHNDFLSYGLATHWFERGHIQSRQLLCSGLWFGGRTLSA